MACGEDPGDGGRNDGYHGRLHRGGEREGGKGRKEGGRLQID